MNGRAKLAAIVAAIVFGSGLVWFIATHPRALFVGAGAFALYSIGRDLWTARRRIAGAIRVE